MERLLLLLNRNGYITVILLIMGGFALASCNSTDGGDTSLVEYSGDFIKASDNVTTSATGSATATIDTDTHEVTFEAQWQGLSSPVAAMHFHDNGPVIHGIEGWQAATTGSVSGTVNFSAGEADDLEAGMVYIQIHTESYPGGEVVAPLTRQ